MGKINLIDQLRKRGSGGSAPKSSLFSFSKTNSGPENSEIEFEESSDSQLDAYEKRKVAMLLLGILLVLAGRQLVPLYTQSQENTIRTTISDLDNRIAEEKKKDQDLKQVQIEMQQYDGRVGDLRAKLQKVQQLEAGRNLLVRMTDYIIKEMPQRLWFETLEVNTREKVNIVGYSTNYQIVSDFMKKLEGAIYFPKWKLVQTDSQSVHASLEEGSGPVTMANDKAFSIPSDSKKFVLEADAVGL